MEPVGAQPILCGVDNSSEARAAAHFAAALARRLGAPLVLAHVAVLPATVFASTPGSVLGYPIAADRYPDDEGLIENAHLLLDEIARALPVGAGLIVRTGSAFDGLLDLFGELNAQLVVVGAHRRGAIERAVVGSMWARLAADDRCPVAVVSASAEVSCSGPVLVGYDGSPGSDSATLFAARLAAQMRTALDIANVIGDEAAVPALDDAMRVRLHAAAAGAVAPARGGSPPEVEQAPIDVRFVFSRGEPAKQLAELAAARDAAFVVTSSRGRGSMRSAVLGSVSHRVVELAARPVLIVPLTAQA